VCSEAAPPNWRAPILPRFSGRRSSATSASSGSSASQWVGTGRTAELCFPIPPVATVRATFIAHGDRLRGLTVLSAPLTSARIPKPSHSTGLLRTHLLSCGPSPCGRLSRPQTTMATLTSDSRIRGFLRLFPTPYFRSRYHRLKDLPCSHRWTPQDRLGGGYRQPIPAYRGSRVGIE
jgi:hypothetical protein